MAVYSAEPWHIGPTTVGATTIDRDFDVPDDPQWDYPLPSRDAINPCNGNVTTIYALGAGAKAQGRITFIVQADDDLDDALADLEAVWLLHGPWTIRDAEGVTRSMMTRPSLGNRTRINKGYARVVSLPFQEV